MGDAVDSGQLTVIEATNVVHFCTSVKDCRERPMCRSGGVEITTRVDKTKQPPAPWLSLWESWLGAAETERALRRFYNENVHLNSQRWPSPSELRSATSPKGRGKGRFLRIRPLFVQRFTPPRRD